MIQGNLLDELLRGIRQVLPADVDLLRSDLDKNLRAALQQALARMNLVTREEFEVQASLLARSREKLKALEQRVQALEAALKVK